MKIKTLTTAILIFLGTIAYGQTIIQIEKPDSVTKESKFLLYPSKVLIPIQMNQSFLKELIDKATPEKQRVSDEDDTEELNFSFNISDKETKFNNTTITHNLRLTNGDGSYRRRGYIVNPWPLGGRTYGPWVRVDCDDIRGNATINISVSLAANYQVNATGDFKAEIDNVQCAQFNMTGIVRAFGWHDFKQDINKNLAKELKKIDFKTPVADVWTKIQTPYKISNDFYLLIKPDKLMYKDLLFEEGLAKTSIGLSFYATTGNATDSASWIKNIPLPDLVKNPAIDDNNIELNLPVNLPYTLMDTLAKEKLRGQIIKGKEKKYAKILDAEIYGSKENNYDVVIGLKTKVYRTLFKQEMAEIYLHAKLDYDTIKKSLYVKEFKLDSKTESGLYNFALEAIANKLAYSYIINKLQFNVSEAIEKQKLVVNKLLENKIEITKGVKISGFLNSLEIKQLISQPDRLFCLFTLKGNSKVEVLEIK